MEAVSAADMDEVRFTNCSLVPFGSEDLCGCTALLLINCLLVVLRFVGAALMLSTWKSQADMISSSLKLQYKEQIDMIICL